MDNVWTCECGKTFPLPADLGLCKEAEDHLRYTGHIHMTLDADPMRADASMFDSYYQKCEACGANFVIGQECPKKCPPPGKVKCPVAHRLGTDGCPVCKGTGWAEKLT